MTRRQDYTRQTLAGKRTNYLILGLIAVAVIFPVYWMLATSLTSRMTGPGGIIPDFSAFSFDAYAEVLSGRNFGLWYLNTTVVALVTTVLAVTLSVFAGYALARFYFPGRSLFGSVIILIQLAPGVLIAIPMYAILHDAGLLNSYVGLSAAYITRALPFCTWMLWGFFRQLPVELEEAAMVDGANRWQVLRSIALPMSWQGIAVAAMFTFVLAWEEYLFALMIMTKETSLTLTVGASRLVTTESVAITELMAYSVLMTIPVAIVFGFVQKHMVHGLAAGALKG